MNIEWSSLESNQRLCREKCARDVADMLSSEGSSKVSLVEERMIVLLSHETWEGRHGGLLLVQAVLKWYETNDPRSPKVAQWVDPCMKLLVDKEVRVRMTSGETLALLCRVGGVHLYDEKIAAPLLSSIESNMTLERDAQAFLDDDEATKALREKLLAGEAAQQAKKTQTRGSRASSLQSTIFHDTAGWGTLETDVCCLQQILEKCGAEFAPRLVSQEELLDLLYTCALHMNRFVREAAFRALDAAISCLHKVDSTKDVGVRDNNEGSSTFLLDQIAQSTDLVARLGTGLCDEWPNVRMQASVCLRSFLLAMQTEQRQQRYFDELLPKMCVNRYYVAAGVAAYAQETWRQIIGVQGRQIVAKWLPSIVPFYIMQTKLANSEARISAAKCIGELAARIDKAAVAPYAIDLFGALIPRLSKGDAWEVKGTASASLAEFVRAFPDRFHLSSDFPELVSSLSANLADVVWSVREGAAIVLGELVKASDEGKIDSVLELCLVGLTAATREVNEQQKYGKEDLASLKYERFNDVTLHTNQETIDCCAVGDLDADDSEQLATLKISTIFNLVKAHRLTEVDMGLDRWERTDGCFYLVRELARSNRFRDRDSMKAAGLQDQAGIEDAVGLMARVSTLRHFVKHSVLLTTLWTVLPDIAKALGVEVFKKHMSGFKQSLAYSVSCNDPLTVDAAKACVIEFSRVLGSDVFSDHPQLAALISQ
eukprot:TRINITY_DN9833_c0_g4_i1.p1 TRINITY_DN9833_c0_g4~~TRINITY_DN9833_c0_g4_i1.p1  ORF type:complete len:712 (-),score=99.65 TRINITY_DN9833_c0_g4_i1:10-2145(-)